MTNYWKYIVIHDGKAIRLTNDIAEARACLTQDKYNGAYINYTNRAIDSVNDELVARFPKPVITPDMPNYYNPMEV